MDTLAYLHLAATHEASASVKPETALKYYLFFEGRDATKRLSGVWFPLLLFTITLTSVSVSNPAFALKKGETSSQVTSLQKKLAAAGYFKGPFTGYYGPLTRSAVMQFQKARGLTVDGIAGSSTLKALESASETSAPPQPTSPISIISKIIEAPQESPRPTETLQTTRTLQKGNKSSEVTSLQKKLQAAGYFKGPTTGYYGSLTQVAVTQFQKANGLPANGIADIETLNALASASGTAVLPQRITPPAPVPEKPSVSSPPARTLQKGNRSSEVTSLQKKLAAMGYFKGPTTGYYGSLTQAAVTQFQKANGLPANGVADIETLNALNSVSKVATPVKPAPSLSQDTQKSQAEISRNLGTPKITPANPQTPNSQKTTSPNQGVTENSKVEKPTNSNSPQKVLQTPQTPNTPEKTSPALDFTDESQVKKSGNFNPPEKTSKNPQTSMKLKKTISGKISPKSVVSSGAGLFFAQNMMYSHTITVYDRNYNLVKTIPDTVNLSKYGHSKYKANYKGAPVEASFSHNGKYAWVSNYKMYGPGFNNPGDDVCSPAQKTDKSFLYRIDTDTLDIEKVIQVGSVPKFVATSPDNRLVLVSNWCSWDLSVVDTEQNKEIKRIKLGRYPRGIVVDADSEEAYIAVMGSRDIAKVDLDDFSVKWLKNVGQSPRHLNIDPNDKYLFASLNGEGRIAKIDLSTGKVLKKAYTGNAPRSMVISDDGERLYVVNYSSNTVSKVRTSDMKVLQQVKVGANPIGITYDPQTREVWVACYSGSIMVFQD
ncbi:MAG TPA: peptidoglycan-binding protein [Coleofasciculaceae cyanobacterium]